jgi:uncharacterized membrane protein YecN with MAPEG domain
MADPNVLILIVVGIVLVIGSVMTLTTFGARAPRSVLLAMFIAFAAYMSVVLVRLGVLDITGWFSGGS